MDESCIFCKIIKGEAPSFKVWEDVPVSTMSELDPNRGKPATAEELTEVHQKLLRAIDEERE